MKKFILAAMIAVSSLNANAQVWMGGSLGLNFTKPDGGETVTTFTIAPEVGYSLNDKWDIALSLNEQLISWDGETANSFSIAPYARYTFAKSGIASFFVDGGFGVGSTDYNNGYKLHDSRTSWFIGVRPGIKVALSNKVCLVSHLGWLGYENVEDSYSRFGFGVDNTAVDFGMYWNF